MTNGRSDVGNAIAVAAFDDSALAYQSAIGMNCTNVIVSGQLAGKTVTPGVSCASPSSQLSLAFGSVTLDGKQII